MPIHELDNLLVNQIAAGEVIERPSSIVKELVENSLDAGATALTIEVEEGGIRLLKVTDNGSGIPRAELPLALRRHATSKISSVDDLSRIATLGFRGEALSSIAAVTHFKLLSRVASENVGWQISADGEEIVAELAPKAHPIGTMVEARELFFNVPARRKFLRKEATEFSHIVDILSKIALSRFDVAFKLINNQKAIWDLPPVKSNTESTLRIAKLFDSEFIEHAYCVAVTHEPFKLTGWISAPGYTRSQADLQYFYLNGRIIRDKLFSHAVKQAYQSLMFEKRFPLTLLYLEINPELVDVNVHPTKAEVRFADGNSVHNFLIHALKNCLENGAIKNLSDNQQKICDLKESAMDDNLFTKNVEQKIALSFDKLDNGLICKSDEKPFTYRDKIYQIPQTAVFKHQDEIKNYQSIIEFAKRGLVQKPLEMTQSVLDGVDNGTLNKPLGRAIAQLGNMYLLAENDEGLIIVDIHAAHERINYEILKREAATGGVQKQELLLPYVVTLNERELSLIEEYQTVLAVVGLEITRNSEYGILVRTVPILLSKLDVAKLIKDLLGDLNRFAALDTMQRQIDHLIATMACHASVRAGENLTLAEMDQLLRQMEVTLACDRCSHGRPTWIKMSFSELAKKFLRT